MATKKELLKMVRQFCSECMGGPRATEQVWPVINPGEIGLCTAPECIWFKYRFAKDPDKPLRSKKQKELDQKRILYLKNYGRKTA